MFRVFNGAVNGVLGLNGYSQLLDDDNKPMRFAIKTQAINFLRENGVTDLEHIAIVDEDDATEMAHHLGTDK